jgi:hypothetical protein
MTHPRPPAEPISAPGLECWIEDREDMPILVFAGQGCRPAEETEIYLWNRLHAAEKRAKEDAEVMKAWGRQIVELQARLARLGADSTEDKR